MKTLLNYQQDFYKAIFTNDPTHLRNAIGQIDDLEERFKICSNNVFASLKHVLKDDFPNSRAYVGDQKFNQASFEFVRNFPPHSGCLLSYGNQFPEFLEALCPSRQGILDIARLEWKKKELYYARNTSPLKAEAMNTFQSEEMENLTFDFPHASFLLSSNFNLQSFWEACEQGTPEKTLKSGASYSLLIRPHFKVEHYWLSQEDYTFFSSLYKKRTLGEAYEQAISVAPGFDLMSALKLAFERNYFTNAEVKNEQGFSQ